MRSDHSVPSNYRIQNPQTELVQCTRRGENATSRKKVLIRTIHLLYFLVVLFIDIIDNIRFKGCEAPQLQPINVHGWLVERGGSVSEVGHLALVGDIGQHIGHDHTALVS